MTDLSNIIHILPPMRAGEDLFSALEVLPKYDESICTAEVPVRLMALSDLYRIYVPSQMSLEIYSKMYLALLRSLQKKSTKLAVQQKNQNHKAVIQQEYSGIMGGSDSFTIIGASGIGKSSAISRTITLITENGVIEVENPYTKIIPCICVQCPFDSSVKGLLLEILRKVDETIDSKYYQNALRARTTTDMLIGSVSQIALNHIGLLVVDEIQNIVNHRQGKSLVGMLTQLINNSGISICMVGTPEAETFFESVDYLARRALGLRYGNCEYNAYFREFCNILFQYQYVGQESIISDGIIQWLYEHSAGVLAVVVSLIHDAQEISILSGRETLDMVSLNEAYEQRMNMLHSHIKPSVVIKRDAVKKKKRNSALEAVGSPDGKEKKEDNVPPLEVDAESVGSTADSIDRTGDSMEPVIYSADKSGDPDWSFMELAEQAKRNRCDMLSLLKGKISITEIAV